MARSSGKVVLLFCEFGMIVFLCVFCSDHVSSSSLVLFLGTITMVAAGCDVLPPRDPSSTRMPCGLDRALFHAKNCNANCHECTYWKNHTKWKRRCPMQRDQKESMPSSPTRVWGNQDLPAQPWSRGISSLEPNLGRGESIASSPTRVQLNQGQGESIASGPTKLQPSQGRGESIPSSQNRVWGNQDFPAQPV